MPSLGERLCKKRESLGLTRAQAARIAGLENQQTLYKIEKGLRKVQIDELIALSKAYAFDVNLFLLSDQPTQNANIFWRAEKKPSKPVKKKFELKLKMFLDRFIHLQKILGKEKIGTKLSNITLQLSSLDDAAETGEQYSKMLNLGDRPALVFKEILEEEYNLPIFFFDMPDRTSAISIITSEYAAICVNKREVAWRRNFDIAHELFHILYKQFPPKNCGGLNKDIQEIFANVFASAFLLPRVSIEKEIKRRKGKTRLSIIDLVVMACDYDVSLDALLWRLVNLGYLKRDKAEAIMECDALKQYYKNIRRPGLEKIPYISKKYVCLVFDAFRRGLISEMRAAEYLNVTVNKINKIFADIGLMWKDDSDFEITM